MFLLTGLNQLFEAAEAFLEDVGVRSSLSSYTETESAPILLATRFKLLSAFFAAIGVLHLETNHVVNTLTPVLGVRPNTVVSYQ